jgi:hypothetical protein
MRSIGTLSRCPLSAISHALNVATQKRCVATYGSREKSLRIKEVQGAAGTSQLREAEVPAAMPARPEENHANYDVVENNSDEDAAVTDDGLPQNPGSQRQLPRRTLRVTGTH